jgi:hypothetical protein
MIGVITFWSERGRLRLSARGRRAAGHQSLVVKRAAEARVHRA